VSAGSKVATEAAAFIAALAHPGTAEIWKAAGFERASD